MRTGIYVRISRDATGEALGVERHEAECRELIEQKSWKVVEVYRDNDISASTGKLRPAYERMLGDAAAGELDAIVAWHPDRLHRSPKELERFLDVIERAGVEVATVRAGSWDFSPTGKLAIRMLGNIAKYETEHKAERQRSANVQSAAAGKVHGGGTRPFGYERDAVTVREDEAKVIREVAARLLGGESQNSICRDISQRGVRTVTGKVWVPVVLRQMMMGARISGRRERHGEIVGQAVWPGIIRPEDSDRLRVVLKKSARVPGAPVTYLLSGLLVCGRCGRVMVGKAKDGVPRYVCRVIAGTQGCGDGVVNTGVSASGPKTDALVRDMVIEALSGPKLRQGLKAKRAEDPKARAELEGLRNRRAMDLELLDEGLLTVAEFKARSKEQLARIEQLERKLERANGPDPLSAFIGTVAQMEAKWGVMNNSQRRAICDAVLERVEVLPVTSVKGVKGKWDPTRFRPVWKA